MKHIYKLMFGSGVIMTLVVAPYLSASANVNPTLPTDSLTIFTSDKAPRIGLPDAQGAYSTDSLIDMYQTEHGYEADSVKIENGGFRFYAADTSSSDNPDDWTMQWYSLANFAVNPPLAHYLNPLYQYNSAFTQPEVPLEDGYYHIWYFDQTDHGQHYNLFTFAPEGDNEEEVGFPPAVYLIGMDNEGIAIPEEPDQPGVYRATIALPAPDFKVAYQKEGYWIPGFIFGPQNAAQNSLASNDKIPIEYGVNTWVALTYSTASDHTEPLAKGVEAKVEVNFSGEENYIMIVRDLPTGVEGIYTEGSAEVLGFYGLDGVKLEAPKLGTMAIIKYTDGTSKLTVM